jgi:hypothetical protein
MLKQIALFEKEAVKFKLDPNSVVAFETWSEFKAAAKTAGRKNDSLEEFNLFIEAKKLSDEAQDFISKKIEILRNEGKDADQASAIAYSMARQKGYDVPAPPKKGSVDKTSDGFLGLDEKDEAPADESGDDHEDDGDEESHEEGDESPEEEAKELMAKWEAGEMSLKEVFRHLDEEFEEDQEEKTEEIIADMIDKKFKELTGSEEETETGTEEGEAD